MLFKATGDKGIAPGEHTGFADNRDAELEIEVDGDLEIEDLKEEEDVFEYENGKKH